MSTGLPGPGPGSRRWGQRLRAAGYRCGGRLSCDACGPRVLSLILAMAVKDGRPARNAAAGVSLPRVVREERQYLTHTEVERLAEACAASPGEPISKHRRFSERRHQEYRLIVPFLAYPGVRFGELAAPGSAGWTSAAGGRSSPSRSPWSTPRQVFGTPTSHERREVPIPPFLVEELAAQVSGRGPDDLVFPGTESGGPLRASVFRLAAFAAAAAGIGRPGLHPHELRHTAASLAIAGLVRGPVRIGRSASGTNWSIPTYGYPAATADRARFAESSTATASRARPERAAGEREPTRAGDLRPAAD